MSYGQSSNYNCLGYAFGIWQGNINPGDQSVTAWSLSGGVSDNANAIAADLIHLGHFPTVTTIRLTWDEAKRIYKRELSQKNQDFFYNAFVGFYLDDYKFDGPRGILHDSTSALIVLRHFAGVITPDYSTYQDFPEPMMTLLRNYKFMTKLLQNAIANFMVL